MTFFIAGVCIAVIPYEKCVYLFDSHSRDSFWMSTTNGFSIFIKFPNYESAALYIYNLFVNSTQVQFENQFIKSNISNFFNEEIPVSLIGCDTRTNNKQNSIEKKDKLNVAVECEFQSVDSSRRSEKC